MIKSSNVRKEIVLYEEAITLVEVRVWRISFKVNLNSGKVKKL